MTMTASASPASAHAGTSIVELSAETFDAQVLQAHVPVLVDFTATWCSPCRALTPILQKIAHEGGGAVMVGSVDGDDAPGICARYGVKSFPTIVAFVNGREVARHVGLTSKERLLGLLRAG